MAGDGIVYEWNDADLQRLVRDGISRVGDMTPVMKDFSEYMVLRTKDRFRDEKAPDGRKWEDIAPLSTVTIEKKDDDNAIDKILHHNGYLRLVHPHADKDSGGVYSDKVYAAIHNRGGWAGWGRKVRIPQRKFLGFNLEDIKEFQAAVLDWVVNARR